MDSYLHAKYGPVVRKAPNLVIFNDPRLLPLVYHRTADKTDQYRAMEWFGILGIRKHAEHAELRKKLAGQVQPPQP